MSLANRPWAEVRNDLFGEPYMVWHDGPDFTGLRDAWRAEPEALIEQLFAGMAEGDALAAQSLSELDPPPTGEQLTRVIAALEKHVASSPPYAQVQLGLTLYKLTGDPKWTAPIAEVLDADVHWSSRIDAAIALRQVAPTPELTQSLLRNVQAADYLVRFHSATTLLRWSGTGKTIDEYDDALFGLLVKDDDPTAWKQVADALAQLTPPKL